MKTAQQIFNQVKTHLLTQNETAMNHGGCQYRTGTGLACAIGCLITDENYSLDMEANCVEALFVGFPDAMANSGLSVEHQPLLEDLQDVHDMDDPDTWADRLIVLAGEWKLEYN